MTARRHATTRSWMRRPEPLETRELLHGHGFAGLLANFAAAAAVSQRAGIFADAFPAGALAAARHRVFAELGAAASAERTALTASLTDSETGASATVVYRSYTVGDETVTRLKVSVTGAAADSTLDVTVGETVVGQVVTDENGDGTLVLASEPADDQQPLPDDFPTDIAAGTAIAVGTMTGTLETPLRAPRGHGGCHARGAALSAPLSDSESEATGTAVYRTFETDDGVQTTLTVSVTGATAEATLDVSLDEVIVGQIETDATGAGSIALASNPTAGQKPWPSTAPTVVAGTTIRVGSLTGAFATISADHGLRFDHRR